MTIFQNQKSIKIQNSIQQTTNFKSLLNMGTGKKLDINHQL